MVYVLNFVHIFLFLSDADPSLDWTVRQGHAVGLSVALKESPTRLCVPEFQKRVMQATLDYTAADRVCTNLESLTLSII